MLKAFGTDVLLKNFKKTRDSKNYRFEGRGKGKFDWVLVDLNRCCWLM